MIKIAQWGCGAMGAGMMKLARTKSGLTLVGAVDQRPELTGKDAGQVAGDAEPWNIPVSLDGEKLLRETRPDIVLLATSSFTNDIADTLRVIIRNGADIITIAEEMTAPAVKSPELARELDDLARANDVTILGTGINPGFVLDTLILTLTGTCRQVDAITASRVNDLAPYGPMVMRTQGIGLTPEEFEQGVADGSVAGHIGFAESITIIAQRLGWQLDDIIETKAPIVAKTIRKGAHISVAPGRVAGCRHTATGLRDGQALITLEHPQQIQPAAEDLATGDFIKIQGDPDILLRIEPEIPGGIGTVALAVNMIPAVLAAGSGLKSMADMPMPYCLPKK